MWLWMSHCYVTKWHSTGSHGFQPAPFANDAWSVWAAVCFGGSEQWEISQGAGEKHRCEMYIVS